MTYNEYLQLDNTIKYDFHLYYGEKKTGWIEDKNNKYYVVFRRAETRDSPIEDIGFEVKLDQIVFWQPFTNSLTKRSIPPSVTINNNPSAKILVVFGAGASHDYSFGQLEERPPLAKDLFQDAYSGLLSFFPGAQNLSPQILHSDNIEKYFQEQWNKIKLTYNPLLLKKLINTQYYIQKLLENQSEKATDVLKNNYISFVQHLNDYLVSNGNEKAILTSFNYDTILEKSLTHSLNYKFERLEDYVDYEARNLLLFKPHGSWNWVKHIEKKIFTEVNNPEAPSTYDFHKILYDRELDLAKINRHIENDIKIIKKNNDIDLFYFPQLLIPYSDKDEFVMPDSHIQILKHLLKDIKLVLVIGWKGTEKHFKKLLAKEIETSKVHIVYVTLKDETVEKELKECFPDGIFSSFAPFENSKGTFSELASFLSNLGYPLFERSRL